MYQALQLLHVADDQRAAVARQQAALGQVVQLPRHRLAVSADAAGDVGMGRRRRDARRLALVLAIPRQAQHLGMNAVLHPRPEERRVGKWCVLTVKSRWSADHKTKTK